MDCLRFSPYEDWSALVGGFVEIRRESKFVTEGCVDAVMPDSSALWIAADVANSRALYSKAEGYEVWISPKHLQSPAPTLPTMDPLPLPRMRTG